MSETQNSEVNGNNSDSISPTTPKKWVKFDDETQENPNVQKSSLDHTVSSPSGSSVNKSRTVAAAVINTETVHVNLDRSEKSLDATQRAGANVDVNMRHGFSNGDVIVTLLPVNTKWPWITSAQFRPELVPEELMAQGLTLTVEEYVHAMELLVNDFRFTIYNICYKRVLVCWITLAFLVLLALLFSGLTGLTLFTLGVFWLVLNAAAIFLCMWIKLKLSKGLEKCLANVNKLLNKHNLVLALDDRGRISCHKVNLCFIYFDPEPCIHHIEQFIDSEEGKTIMQGWEKKLDVPTNDIVIQGTQSTRISRKQDRGTLLLVRYVCRWGALVAKEKMNLSSTVPGRHGTKVVCPCQFIEEHLKIKPPTGIAKYFTLPNQNVHYFW